ncbi:twin-arginine translocation signal domain-containing protein, partial [Burkholderia multivorans]|uniref:twin-arginine translocation signal domain-containing protein n=1 Tax=Burkholderia multivorans TaxID=87883 RepID=UPI003C12B5E1
MVLRRRSTAYGGPFGRRNFIKGAAAAAIAVPAIAATESALDEGAKEPTMRADLEKYRT